MQKSFIIIVSILILLILSANFSIRIKYNADLDKLENYAPKDVMLESFYNNLDSSCLFISEKKINKIID